MLTLWLARHGEAIDPDSVGSDFDRTLTPEGRRRLAETARFLISREQPPEAIFHSPLVRARQTAEVLAAEMEVEPTFVRLERTLSPGVTTDSLLSVLASTALERVVCVGHQPDMSRCLAEMIGGGNIAYHPGTIASIRFDGPIMTGTGHLEWLVMPKWF